MIICYCATQSIEEKKLFMCKPIGSTFYMHQTFTLLFWDHILHLTTPTSPLLYLNKINMY